jgi:hypothetical protein
MNEKISMSVEVFQLPQDFQTTTCFHRRQEWEPKLAFSKKKTDSSSPLVIPIFFVQVQDFGKITTIVKFIVECTLLNSSIVLHQIKILTFEFPTSRWKYSTLYLPAKIKTMKCCSFVINFSYLQVWFSIVK